MRVRLLRIAALAACLACPAGAQAQMLSAGSIDGAAMADLPAITVHQDWQILCAAGICQAEPRTGGPPDLSVTILQDDDGQVMILRAPLGLLLGEGVAVTVDGRSVGRLAFLTCEPDGCVAPVRLDGALVRALRGGTALTLTLVRRDGTKILGAYSLLGFIAAMAALDAGFVDQAATP